jgi:hypothetical protein
VRKQLGVDQVFTPTSKDPTISMNGKRAETGSGIAMFGLVLVDFVAFSVSFVPMIIETGIVRCACGDGSSIWRRYGTVSSQLRRCSLLFEIG